MLNTKNQRRDSSSILIKGGHLIDPAAKINAPMDVLLRDDRVTEVALPNKIRGTADEKFDARGLILSPGFIDLHHHLREPRQSYKETIATRTHTAAAVGGVGPNCCRTRELRNARVPAPSPTMASPPLKTRSCAWGCAPAPT